MGNYTMTKEAYKQRCNARKGKKTSLPCTTARVARVLRDAAVARFGSVNNALDHLFGGMIAKNKKNGKAD